MMRRFKSARHLQRFASVHDQAANLFMNCRYHTEAKQKRSLRTHAFEARTPPTRWGVCAPDTNARTNHPTRA
jgi:putative transposase